MSFNFGIILVVRENNSWSSINSRGSKIIFKPQFKEKFSWIEKTTLKLYLKEKFSWIENLLCGTRHKEIFSWIEKK